MPSPFGAKNKSFVTPSMVAKKSFCLRPASTVNLYDLPGVAGPAVRSPTGVSNTPALVNGDPRGVCHRDTQYEMRDEQRVQFYLTKNSCCASKRVTAARGDPKLDSTCTA